MNRSRFHKDRVGDEPAGGKSTSDWITKVQDALEAAAKNAAPIFAAAPDKLGSEGMAQLFGQLKAHINDALTTLNEIRSNDEDPESEDTEKFQQTLTGDKAASRRIARHIRSNDREMQQSLRTLNEHNRSRAW